MIDPYSWFDADGSFEINIVVGDAAEWNGMSRPVGLDLFDDPAVGAEASFFGGWSEPLQSVSFSDNVWYRYRIHIEPDRISHKIWADADPEPAVWTAIDTAPEGQDLMFSPSHLWIMNANYGVRLYLDWIKIRD